MANPEIVEFEGKVAFEKYYNDQTSWGAYSVNSKTDIPHCKNIEYTDYMTDQEIIEYQVNLSGKMQRLIEGMTYTFKAKAVNNSKYGWGYEPISISQDLPKTDKEQFQFLSSIVAHDQARTLLNIYPNIVEEIISGTDCVDLSLTKGIKEKTYDKIKQKVLENYAFADIISLLAPLGISFNTVHKLLNFQSNVELLKQQLIDDPYIITQIDGIGFKKADDVALKINPSLLISEQRVKSFIKYYLQEIGSNDGHTWILIDELKTAIKENLIECEDIFKLFIKKEQENKTFLYFENDKVGLNYFHFVEQEIWRMIQEFNKSDPLYISKEDIDAGILDAEKELGQDKKEQFHYSDEQKKFLIKLTKNNFSILTGKSGVGKTSLTRGLFKIYGNYNIGACSLSAKASRRITEVTGQPAYTIHKLLGSKGPNEFTYNEYNKLPYDIIIVDEISLCFSGLFYHLISAIKDNAKIVLVGDSGQLNPISWGNLLVDLLEKKDLNICYLTKIQRQAAASGIISSANLIREGIDPLNNEKTFKKVYGELQDMYFMFREKKEELFTIAVKTYLKTVEKIGLDDTYLITPRKECDPNSTYTFNKTIQDILLDDTLPYVKFGKKSIFKLGAKVIHRVNNYDLGVTNGEQGYVVKIKNMGKDGGDGLVVEYPDKIIEYTKENLKELHLAYAITVHSAQGSEAHTCIVVLDSNSFVLLNNALLYTAITRSKSRCLLLSQPFAYNRCVSTNVGNKRNTWTQFFE